MVLNRLDLRRVAGLAGVSLAVVLLTYSYTSAFAAKSSQERATEILHQPLRCWPALEYVVSSADVRPADDVQKTVVYFRGDRHPAWSFVPMTLNAQGTWVAIVPKTQPERGYPNGDTDGHGRPPNQLVRNRHEQRTLHGLRCLRSCF